MLGQVPGFPIFPANKLAIGAGNGPSKGLVAPRDWIREWKCSPPNAVAECNWHGNRRGVPSGCLRPIHCLRQPVGSGPIVAVPYAQYSRPARPPQKHSQPSLLSASVAIGCFKMTLVPRQSLQDTMRGNLTALSAAFLGWLFDGLEMGMFPLGRPSGAYSRCSFPQARCPTPILWGIGWGS
jgi:hypothetical protein